MTEADPEVAWVPLDFRKWLAGTADLSAEAEFVFWRLCLLVYDTQQPIIDRSAARVARWCKLPPERLEIALAELVDAEKVKRSEGGIYVPSAEKHLDRAKSNLGNRQRGAAIARRTVALQKQGKDADEIAAILAVEFPERAAKPQRPVRIVSTTAVVPADTVPIVATQPAPAEPDMLLLALGMWNTFADAHSMPKVQKLTDSRRTKLRQRLKECGGLDGWQHALDLMGQSPFLLGATGWHADFDFLMQESKFTKLMEGGYADKQPTKSKSSTRDALQRQMQEATK